MRSGYRYLGYAVMAITVTLLAAGLILGVRRTLFETVAGSIGAVTFAVTGHVVTSHKPSNPLGWIMLWFGATFALDLVSVAYIQRALSGSEWMALLNSTIWLPALVALVVFVPLLFPDGRLPSRRWRWVLWLAPSGVAFFIGGNLFAANALSDFGLENPVAIWEDTHDVALVGFVFILTSLIGAVSAAVTRFRRSRGEVRQQMKWFAAAALMLLPTLAVQGAMYESGRSELARAIFMLGALLIPLAIGRAVLRYRLYDIDRIISRTVAYAFVMMTLALIFAMGVVVIPNQIPGMNDSPILVAGSTLVVAALFSPLRMRVQQRVDRRFNRSRYDAERVMDGFALALRDRVDLDYVLDGLMGVVSETMQPQGVSVWVSEAPRVSS